MAAREVNPLAVVGNQRREVLAKPVGEKQRGTVRCQDLCDLMDQALRHRQGTIPHVDGQDQLAHRVHRDPHPVRGTGQALDRLLLAALTVFDGTEQGEEFVHLHLLNVEIAQGIA